jgi:hypothetical protein
LRIEDLQSVDHVEALAEQYRNGKLSKEDDPSTENRLCKKNITHGIIITICLLAFLLGLIFGIIKLRTKFYSTGI